MNMLFDLLSEYFYKESFTTGVLVILCFLLNSIQTNGISILIANIIRSIETGSIKEANFFFYSFVGVAILYIALYYIYKVQQNSLLTKIKPWIRFQLTKMLLIQNNEQVSKSSFIDMNPHINRIAHILFMMSNDLLTFFLPTFVFILVIAIYLFYQSVAIGTGFLLGNLCILGYSYFVWQDLLQKNENYETDEFESEKYLIEILNNMDLIIYRGQTANEISIFEDYTEEAIRSGYTFYSSVNVYETVSTFIAYFTIVCIVGYLIQSYFQKRVSNVVFITLITIIMLYRDKIGVVIQQVSDIIEFLGRCNISVDEFAKMNMLLKEEKRGLSPISLSFDTIVFEDISFQYRADDKKIFDHFNLSIPLQKKIIGITGVSGKGKSTFAKLLLKMYDFSGNIFIDGVNTREIEADYIRQNIVYINQNAKLFNKKIVENIIYGCQNPDSCKENLKVVFEKYPKIRNLYKDINIYEQYAGSLGENLSGGQRQIANIISGLINPASILILDEPTNALDGELKKEVLDLIRHFSKEKKSILIITHDRDVYPLFQSTIQI